MPKRTDFISNFVIVNNAPAWINFDEGRVIMDGTAVHFTETHLKDHLGNTRVVFGRQNNALVIKQVNSYYPFGMNIKGLSTYSLKADTKHPANEYLYNGKMFQDELGLDWLDYGARMYDAVLGRWHGVDPLSEFNRRWSPYRYAYNNPMRFIDPDGMLETKYEDEEVSLLLETQDGSDDVVTVPNDKVDDYKKHAEFYEVEGMKEVYDSPSWNDNAKMDLLGFESIDELKSLDNTSSQLARQKLIDFYQDDRSLSSWANFLIAEVGSQNANLLNHLPTPKIKGPKLKASPSSRVKPSASTPTPAKANPWHTFRREMGEGAFTKNKYGSTEAATKAKSEAYKKWKKENGYGSD